MNRFMKILWVSSVPIGPASKILNLPYSGTSGGWINSEYEKMNLEDNKMYFLTSTRNISEDYICNSWEKGSAYCIKSPINSIGIKTPKKITKIIDKIIEDIKPDIIHIWGTESYISNAVSKSKYPCKKVVYIQGLIGMHIRYLGGYFKSKDNKPFLKNSNIISLLRNEWIRYRYYNQALIEKNTIINAGNVIIDSDFAKAYCESISNKINCHILQLEPNSIFYRYSWNLDDCERFSIFTIYGANFEKGLHQLVKAVNIVKKKYPKVKLIIPGYYPLDPNGLLKYNSKNSFINSLRQMIDIYELRENIKFVGKKTPREMAEQIAKANVYVNPSCMEVHALSLREAMAVGAPCISSMCGSVIEFMQHRQNGLIYRYEEFEVLAHYIIELFENDKLSTELSSKAKQSLKTQNCKSLIDIYNGILNKNE